MNKILSRALALAGTGALALSLAACGGSSADANAGSDGKIKVGASPVPHAKILNYLIDSGEAKKAGLDIEVVEFTDYVKPNEALNSGELEATYYQTVPYLEKESASRGYKFEAGKGIHLEPLAIYSDKHKSLDELKDGATIAVISDPTNQGRALKLLGDAGLVKVTDSDQTVATVKSDPKMNPRGFQFHEVEGPALAASLPDVDIAVINGNFAQEAGLKPSESLKIESAQNNPSVNVLVWRAGEKGEDVTKLEKLLHSDAVKKFIKENWPDGSVIPAF